MGPGLSVLLLVVLILAAVAACVLFALWAGANIDLVEYRDDCALLINACENLILKAVQKNTITEEWECRLCGDLSDRDDGHHSECPVWLAKVAIAKAEGTTNG